MNTYIIAQKSDDSEFPLAVLLQFANDEDAIGLVQNGFILEGNACSLYRLQSSLNYLRFIAHIDKYGNLRVPDAVEPEQLADDESIVASLNELVSETADGVTNAAVEDSEPATIPAPVSPPKGLSDLFTRLSAGQGTLDDLREFLGNGGHTHVDNLKIWSKLLMSTREQMLMDMKELTVDQLFSDAKLNPEQEAARREILKTFDGRLGFPYFRTKSVASNQTAQT